jgi:hypothetical protein
MKLLFRIIVSVLSLFGAVLSVMNLFKALNKGNLFVSAVSITCLIIIVYFTIKTKLFTEFKSKKEE